jgi:hypothetical protein
MLERSLHASRFAVSPPVDFALHSASVLRAVLVARERPPLLLHVAGRTDCFPRFRSPDDRALSLSSPDLHARHAAEVASRGGLT